MTRQLSTSLSDLFLAISAFYVSYYWYLKHESKSCGGMAIQGVAATFGVMRFAMENPNGSVIFKLHKLFSWLAAAVGVPLIAMAFCDKHHMPSLGDKVLFFAIIVVLATIFLPNQQQLFSQAVCGFSLLCITFLSVANNSTYGLSACLTYIIGGMVFGSDGELFGLPYVDFLHYVLILGNTFFKLAL